MSPGAGRGDVELLPLVPADVGAINTKAQRTSSKLPSLRWKSVVSFRHPYARVLLRNAFLILTWCVAGVSAAAALRLHMRI